MFESIVGDAPHLIEQLHAREHTPRVLHEMSEEVKLPRCQIQRASLAFCDAPIKINFQISRAQAPERHGRLAGKLLDSPQDGLHPCCELNDAKGLGKIVVGSSLKPNHSIEFTRARGEHQNRCIRLARAHSAANFKTVESRKSNIQDQETPRRSVLRARQAGVSVMAHVDFAAQIFEMQSQEPRDVVFVLDDEDPAGIHAHSKRAHGVFLPKDADHGCR